MAALSATAVKRYREEENQEENERRKRFKADHFGLSILHVPELAEKIIKNIMEYPRAILSMATVSKMHYNLVHNKSMWVDLGYSPNITSEAQLPHKVLLVLLAQIRLARQTKKLSKLKQEIKATSNISLNAAQEVSGDLQPEEYQQFIANTYLTDKAAKVLLRIMERPNAKHFTLKELVDWLEMPLNHNREPLDFIKRMTFPNRTLPYDVIFTYYKHPFDGDTSLMPQIMSVWTDDGSNDCDIYRFPLADPNKALLFTSLQRSSTSFIKLDKAKNRIECCGDFEIYAAKKFRGDYANALTYLCEEDGSLTYPAWGFQFLTEHHFLVLKEHPDLNGADEAFSVHVVEDIQFRK